MLCETLFIISKIPGDSRVRTMLDSIEPALFYPMFADETVSNLGVMPRGEKDGGRALLRRRDRV